MTQTNIVETLKDRLPINKVLGKYLIGRDDIRGNFKYKCPFHGDGNEKTPSLYASDEKQFFHCFGCKKSGDIITFIREHDKNNELTFFEALEELKETFSDDLEGVNIYASIKGGFNDKDYAYKKLIYEFHEEMNELMVKSLFSNKGTDILSYLQKERKLDLEIIKSFGIGFSDGRKIEDIITEKLKTEKYKSIKRKDTGFFTTNTTSGKPYFLFADRIMFPIKNNRKKIVGWSGGRVFEDQNPKYINSVNNFIYNKSVNLFNIDKVKFGESDTLLICEGNLDSTQLYNYGANNAVSLLGTNLTDSQIALFKNNVRKVVLLLDTDEAGGKALFKITKMLLKVGIIPYMMNIAPQKDIDDFLKQNTNLKGKISNYIEMQKKDILSEYMIQGYVLNKEKMSLEKRYEILSIIRETYNEIEDDIIRIIYKDELKKHDMEFEKLEEEYLEKQKELNNAIKNADETNKEKITSEEWNIDKFILYSIYLLNKGLLDEEDITARNFDLYMTLTSNDIYQKYKDNDEKFIKDFPSEIMEFDLIGKDKETELFNI